MLPAGLPTFTTTDGNDSTAANRKEGAAAVKIGGQSGKTKKLTQTLALSGAAGNALISKASGTVWFDLASLLR